MAAAQTKGHEEDKHTGIKEKKYQVEKKGKRKTKSRKQGTKASKIVLKASPSQQIFPSLRQSRDGDLATPSVIFLLSSAT